MQTIKMTTSILLALSITGCGNPGHNCKEIAEAVTDNKISINNLENYDQKMARDIRDEGAGRLGYAKAHAICKKFDSGNI